MNTPSQSHDQADDERRNPPITKAEVLAACRELELAGEPITRRSVRDKLGRGSMTTIHNGVTEYESQRTPPPPSIELTQEDRDVISELGAQALTVAKERVQHIVAEREKAFQARIEATEARANDTSAAADAEVKRAQQKTDEAESEKKAAMIERANAMAAAEESRQHALRLEGQMAQLMANNAALTVRLHETEQELSLSHTRGEVETAARQKAESELSLKITELADLRTAFQAQQQRDAEQLAHTKELLAAEQARLVELTHQRDLATATMERQESTLSTLSATLARAETALAARDASLEKLAADLAAERGRTLQLTTIVSDAEKHAAALRSLEETVAALALAAENRGEAAEDAE